MKKPSTLELMTYADGEAADPDTIERYLSERADVRAQLAGLAQIGDFVRAYADLRSERAVDIASSVMQQIGVPEQAGAVTRANDTRNNVVTLKRARIGWLISGAVAAAAVIAGLWLADSRPSEQPEMAARSEPQPLSGSELGVAASGVFAADSDPGASIESIDLGGSRGSIFLVSAGDQLTPVVWLSDDNGADEGRMEPL